MYHPTTRLLTILELLQAHPSLNGDALARRLLLEKYEPAYSGDLSEWGRTALPVAVDLQTE